MQIHETDHKINEFLKKYRTQNFIVLYFSVWESTTLEHQAFSQQLGSLLVIWASEAMTCPSISFYIKYLQSTCQHVYRIVLERTPKYRTSTSLNIECPNIKLSEKHILAQNQTSNMSNITKNRTVREHRTVRSMTRIFQYYNNKKIWGLL